MTEIKQAIEEALKELSGGMIYGHPVSNYKSVAEKLASLMEQDAIDAMKWILKNPEYHRAGWNDKELYQLYKSQQ